MTQKVFFPPLRVKFPLSRKSAGLTELGKSVLLFKGVFMLTGFGLSTGLVGRRDGNSESPMLHDGGPTLPSKCGQSQTWPGYPAGR